MEVHKKRHNCWKKYINVRKCGYRCAFLQLCHHDGDKDIATITVITRRLKNVFKTSFVRYECLKDVSKMACVHWERHPNVLNLNIRSKQKFCMRYPSWFAPDSINCDAWPRNLFIRYKCKLSIKYPLICVTVLFTHYNRFCRNTSY